MTAKLSDSEMDQAARVVALFSVLIHAWLTNDFHEAARARDELEGSGFKVQMPRRREALGVTRLFCHHCLLQQVKFYEPRGSPISWRSVRREDAERCEIRTKTP